MAIKEPTFKLIAQRRNVTNLQLERINLFVKNSLFLFPVSFSGETAINVGRALLSADVSSAP